MPILAHTCFDSWLKNLNSKEEKREWNRESCRTTLGIYVSKTLSWETSFSKFQKLWVLLLQECLVLLFSHCIPWHHHEKWCVWPPRAFKVGVCFNNRRNVCRIYRKFFLLCCWSMDCFNFRLTPNCQLKRIHMFWSKYIDKTYILTFCLFLVYSALGRKTEK